MFTLVAVRIHIFNYYCMKLTISYFHNKVSPLFECALVCLIC